ncbi:MAG: hypothetical protein GWO24_25790, partial [Akkermansiaceae bacterium]|nr:hypothetical protein [Akkermansiaceae bacterium]
AQLKVLAKLLGGPDLPGLDALAAIVADDFTVTGLPEATGLKEVYAGEHFVVRRATAASSGGSSGGGLWEALRSPHHDDGAMRVSLKNIRIEP